MKFKALLIIVVAALILPVGAFAVKSIPASLDQLTERAQVVIHGTVRGKIVERDDSGRVYTKVQVAVADTWKGAAGNDFTVVQSGGVLGDRAYHVDGQEPLEVGEEVVLFLVLNQRKQGVVVGGSQGKFKVRNHNGDKSVQNLFHGKDPKAPLKLQSLRDKVKGGRP
jgi:hypothetical protein